MEMMLGILFHLNLSDIIDQNLVGRGALKGEKNDVYLAESS
jgi:hypothetical protein